MIYSGAAFTNNIESDHQKDNLTAYFPAQAGRVYEYIGEGASWKSNGGIKEVYAVDMVVEVPAGIFYDVIVIKTTYPDSKNETFNFSYYAKNIGLIKSLSIISKGTYRIISVLESFSQSKTAGEEGSSY